MPASADPRPKHITSDAPRPGPTPDAVRWTPELLETDPIRAAECFDRAIQGLARRLPPRDAARFLFALDSALYSRLGAAAIRDQAAHADGLHPKHRHTRYHDFFLERIGPGESVADLGCGLGVLAIRLAVERGARVVGVDMSPENLGVASRRAAAAGADVRFVHADIIELAEGVPCADLQGPLDTIILSNVLEHLPDRSALLRSLIKRLGEPRLLIRVPAFERDWRIPYKREIGVEWRLDPTHLIEHTRDELLGEIERAGLRADTLEHRWGEYFIAATPSNRR